MPPKTPRTPAKKVKEDEMDGLIHLRDQEVVNLKELQAELASVEQADRKSADIRAHQKDLEQIISEFGSLHQRIILLSESNSRGPHDTKRKEFKTLYKQVSRTLEQWTEDLMPAAAGPFNALAPVGPPTVVIQQPLPQIIPTFDGRYENWEKFKVMFKDVVDRSNESARIKLYRLDDALIGEAAGAIDDKTIQDGNYDYAWQLLEERYEDKRRMIDLHIGGLLRIEKLTKESHTELRSLLEDFISHVENLKFLGQEFSGVSEQIAVYLLAHALDDDTYKIWEGTIKRGELPKYDEAVKFLKDRVFVLERWEAAKEAAPNQASTSLPLTVPEQPYHIANTAVTSQPGIRCDFCNGRHLTFKCAVFSGLMVHQRMTAVREKNLCQNCLRSGHHWKNCRSQHSCRKCQRRHSTLLHRHPPAPRISGQTHSQPSPSCRNSPTDNAILPTALVTLRDNENQPVPCRILMDTGSQVNFITKSMAARLKLPKIATIVPICGIGEVKTYAKESVMVQLQSRVNSFSATTQCFVVPEVTGMVPSSPVDITEWPIPVGTQLADPDFHKPNRIDMLLGVTMFFRLLKTGLIELDGNQPDLRETHLGWVIAGQGSVHDEPHPPFPANVGLAICDPFLRK